MVVWNERALCVRFVMRDALSVFVLNRSKVKATFETAFEIVFETFHATFNVFVVKE